MRNKDEFDSYQRGPTSNPKPEAEQVADEEIAREQFDIYQRGLKSIGPKQMSELRETRPLIEPLPKETDLPEMTEKRLQTPRRPYSTGYVYHGAVDARFGHRPPDANTMAAHEILRGLYKDFARTINEILPDGRCKVLALTELESASMWSHKAVAESTPPVV